MKPRAKLKRSLPSSFLVFLHARDAIPRACSLSQDIPHFSRGGIICLQVVRRSTSWNRGGIRLEISLAGGISLTEIHPRRNDIERYRKGGGRRGRSSTSVDRIIHEGWERSRYLSVLTIFFSREREEERDSVEELFIFASYREALEDWKRRASWTKVRNSQGDILKWSNSWS